MQLTTCADAEGFLARTRAALQSREAANGLMLGVCGQLVQHPDWYKAPACLKTVDDEDGLVLAAMMSPPNRLVVYGHRGRTSAGDEVLVETLAAEG